VGIFSRVLGQCTRDLSFLAGGIPRTGGRRSKQSGNRPRETRALRGGTDDTGNGPRSPQEAGTTSDGMLLTRDTTKHHRCSFREQPRRSCCCRDRFDPAQYCECVSRCRKSLRGAEGIGRSPKHAAGIDTRDFLWGSSPPLLAPIGTPQHRHRPRLFRIAILDGCERCLRRSPRRLRATIEILVETIRSVGVGPATTKTKSTTRNSFL